MPRDLPLPPTVTAEVKNVEYAEVSASVTISAGSTEGTATITLPAKDINLKSIRVYPPATTYKYSIEVQDSKGNAIYRFRNHSGELVDLFDIIVHDDNASLTVRIVLETAPESNVSFDVKIGLTYVA